MPPACTCPPVRSPSSRGGGGKAAANGQRDKRENRESGEGLDEKMENEGRKERKGLVCTDEEEVRRNVSCEVRAMPAVAEYVGLTLSCCLPSAATIKLLCLVRR
ncbi:hypothetical protein RRG08_037342 [Elysia crispata]|uniref:Uncharacterized protein n=1 Tax=Elysia crispata TaxID=231223 RepID=A0AAE1DYK0_9GAST|nr:hypothetical protein RRG08_037342 [Elysia crispata]